MHGLRNGVLLVASCLALAACGGANTTLPAGPARPTATPTATPAPTPTPVPASVTSSSSLNGGSAVDNTPVTAAVPAPVGYNQSVSIPVVNAAANTKLTTTAGGSPPASIAALTSARSVLSVRTAKDASSYAVVLYDSLTPSANITVSGNISFNETFPAGTLVAGTSYYLAFYDTTQTSPTWQTIAGPVTPTAAGLTFTGSVSSTTLQAGKLYGFATFSGTSPSATPPPAPQTLLYFGNEEGLSIANEAGALQTTLPIPSDSFDIDDSGNIYAYNAGSANGGKGATQLTFYPAGSSTATKAYTPSRADSIFALVSGAGELAAVHPNIGNTGLATIDEWDPGASGTPSREINIPTGATYLDTFAMTHDGTLYVFGYSSASQPEYQVFPPGATTPSQTILETKIPQSQWYNFSPNYSAVGPDGTLYVTEYDFNQPDPNAGLYIYPPSGPERFIATAENADGSGAGPQGVDVDASGNIYVVNNDSYYTSTGACVTGSIQNVTVYNSAGVIQRTVTGAFTGIPITTAADGTSFVSSFSFNNCTNGTQGIFSIAPGATTATMLPGTSGSTEIVLYDGTHKTEPFGTARSMGGASRNGRGVRRLNP